MSGATSPVTSVEDYGKGDPGIAARWITEIDLAEKETRDWHARAKGIEKRYRDDRTTIQGSLRRGAGSYRFNVLWSNVQTLMPAIYARPPKPVVSRRHRDRDPVGRAASQIVERGLDYTIECGDLHSTIKLSVQDFLLGGRGQVWIRYEPKYAPGMPEDGPSISDEESGEETDPAQSGQMQVTDADQGEPDYEEVECDYIYWEDFQCSPARIWKEVRWVARRAYMTRSELRERFKNLTEIEVNSIPLDWKPKHLSDESATVEQQAFMRATVWEVWNKDDRKVYWISQGYSAGPLDVKDDPLRLEGFFPCPRPLMATTTNGTIIPVPDYTEYQDQADQLDDLTGRIAMITKAVKVAGLYAADEREIARLFNEGVENQLLPVNNWAGFMDKGGLERAVMFMPTEKIAAVLRDLTEIRGVIKNDLYEITGIADIIRGSTQASETATAQQIKGRYATMRLSDKQGEVARFVRDILRMMGEVMCEHFSPKTLLLMSDYDQSEDPGPEGAQKVMAAMELLKSDKARGFRIEIEDESTIAQDDQEQKQARLEFLQATSGFLKEAVPAAQAVPELGPLLGKMLLFGVRAFRSGRDMETSIEDALAQLEKAQQAAAQQPKPPSPEVVKAEAESKKAEADLAMTQQDAEVKAMQIQADMEIKKLEMQAKDMAEQRAHEFAMADLELKARQADAADRKMLLESRKADMEHAKTQKEMDAMDLDNDAKFNDNTQTADIASRLDQIESGLMEVATLANNQGEIVQHLKALGAPKRIIRGPDGRATGVESVAAG